MDLLFYYLKKNGSVLSTTYITLRAHLVDECTCFVVFIFYVQRPGAKFWKMLETCRVFRPKSSQMSQDLPVFLVQRLRLREGQEMVGRTLITPRILGARCSKVPIFTRTTVQCERARALFSTVPWKAGCLPHCGSSLIQVPRDISAELQRE